MSELLDIIRWQVRDPYERVLVAKTNKEGKTYKTAELRLRADPPKLGLPIETKIAFVERAVLCGFQAAQRSMGISDRSPKFVVDVRMGKTRGGKKIAGWYIQRKDGSRGFLEYEDVVRRAWRPEKPRTRKAKTKHPPTLPA